MDFDHISRGLKILDPNEVHGYLRFINDYYISLYTNLHTSDPAYTLLYCQFNITKIPAKKCSGIYTTTGSGRVYLYPFPWRFQYM